METLGTSEAWVAEPRTRARARLLRHSRWDAVLIALALLHGLLLLGAPSIWLIALGLWWNANTVSHNFIHRPFFHPRAVNSAFSAYLSVLLGIPQTLWRDRHLAHHSGKPWRLRWSRRLAAESALVAVLWGTLFAVAPTFALTVYLPGFLLGLVLCEVQGRHEHARGVVSHYGGLYNLLFFNDGFHAEHHARPADHWTQLRQRRQPSANSSRWPAVLRWLEWFSLDSLECLVLKSRWLQEFVLRTHERAFRKLMPDLPPAPKVGIIGGGLFPRTALVLQRLRPDARLAIFEANGEHLERARGFLSGNVEFTQWFFDAARDEELVKGLDLLVVPLAFSGDRAAIYEQPPARHVLVHDWLWRPRGVSVTISFPLLKRLNLLQR